MNTPCDWCGLSNVQCDEVIAHRVVWWIWVGADYAWDGWYRLGELRADGWFRWGGLCVNGYFVCMGLCGNILRSVVGAVPMCPSVSPHKGTSIVKIPAHNVCIFGMETSLRGRSGGHTGTAPTVSFGWIACGWLMSFG